MINSTASQLEQLNQLAARAFHQSDLPKATEYLNQALKIAPDHASLYVKQAQVFALLGDFQQAHDCLNKAIQLDANAFEAYHQKAGLFKAKQQYPQALEYLNLALTLKPNDENIYVNIGNTLYEMQQFEFALAHHDFALSLNANNIDAHNGRALAQTALNCDAEALASYHQALELNPHDALTLLNQATLFNKVGRKDAAIQNLEQCLIINPNDGLALCNLGQFYQDQLKVEAATACYLKALALSPHDSLIQWNLAQLYLQMGNYIEGWKLYESGRDAIPSLQLQRKNYPQPLWLGQCSIQGKRLLLHAEQGFGDTIQMVRYAKLACDLGAQVILGLPNALITLMKSLPVDVEVVENTQDCVFDFHCPLMSLPLAFKTNVDNIPANMPYLFADPLKLNPSAIIKNNTLNIGLVWSGSTTHTNDGNRSIALEKLRPLFALNVHFHCLQKEIRHDDLPTLKLLPQVKVYSEQLNDFSDTATLIDQMDIVISVDTSIAHLAGAMGKPVWILLPFAADYRWMLDREDSPWYPTAKLFRQDNTTNWDSVIERVAETLKLIK